jgi:hypothetical protein
MLFIDDTREHQDKFQQFFKNLRVHFKVCLMKTQWCYQIVRFFNGKAARIMRETEASLRRFSTVARCI